MAVFWNCLILLLTTPVVITTANVAMCNTDWLEMMQTLQVDLLLPNAMLCVMQDFMNEKLCVSENSSTERTIETTHSRE